MVLTKCTSHSDRFFKCTSFSLNPDVHSCMACFHSCSEVWLHLFQGHPTSSNQSGHARSDETAWLQGLPQSHGHQPSPFIPLFQWPCTPDSPSITHGYCKEESCLLFRAGRIPRDSLLMAKSNSANSLLSSINERSFLLTTCQECSPFPRLCSELSESIQHSWTTACMLWLEDPACSPVSQCKPDDALLLASTSRMMLSC